MSPARIADPQGLVRRMVQRPARGGEPVGARKGGDVAGAGHEVVRWWRARAARAGRQLVLATIDHSGSRALPRLEPALGDEFGICLGDRIACQPQVTGQGARWREHGPDGEATRADGVA
ncbi:Uncharacterised protein [Mycobacteroides abscessus subsp. massiliense]|nr:Uncharacterised protein [Mycobacteroides abscessus subsp. massiliense]